MRNLVYQPTARVNNLILGCVLARQSAGAKVTLTNFTYVDEMLQTAIEYVKIFCSYCLLVY